MSGKLIAMLADEAGDGESDEKLMPFGLLPVETVAVISSFAKSSIATVFPKIFVIYAYRLEGSITIPCAPLPVSTVLTTEKVVVSIMETVLLGVCSVP